MLIRFYILFKTSSAVTISIEVLLLLAVRRTGSLKELKPVAGKISQDFKSDSSKCVPGRN